MLKFLQYLITSSLLDKSNGGGKRVQVLKEIKKTHNWRVEVASAVDIPGSFRQKAWLALLKIKVLHSSLLESITPNTSMVQGRLYELWPSEAGRWLLGCSYPIPSIILADFFFTSLVPAWLYMFFPHLSALSLTHQWTWLALCLSMSPKREVGFGSIVF